MRSSLAGDSSSNRPAATPTHRGSWARRAGRWAVCACLALFLAGCPGETQGPPPLDERLGPGEVRAGIIRAESELLKGPEAHGWIGDFKLYNDRVAFVVQNIDEPRGWGPYGGNLLDADRVRPAGEAGTEVFQEIIPVLNLMTVHPVSAEIVNDGADGQAAVVRIHGEQRGIPLVDTALGGALEPKALEIVQDYILEPDADYLRIRMELRSRLSTGIHVSGGDLLLPGDQTRGFVSGSGVCRDPPAGTHAWIAAFHPGLCYLYAPAAGSLDTSFSLEGIAPMILVEGDAPPARGDGEPLVIERLIFVGGGGVDACLRAYRAERGEPEGGLLAGTVTTTGGVGEAGAQVVALDTSLAEGQDAIDQTETDAGGAFELALPPGSYRLRVQATGREEALSDVVAVSQGGRAEASLVLPAPARLAYRCEGLDRDGVAQGVLPCKVSLQAGHDAPMNGAVLMDYLTFGVGGSGELVAPSGDYTVTLSHGWEYSIHRENVTLTAGGLSSVEGTLTRQVDTTGFIAADLHSHSTRSIDSWFLIEDKIASNVCEGVEVLVVTDHDCQTDVSEYLDRLCETSGLDLHDWIQTVIGNEVSPLFAHFTTFPLPTHPTGWQYWQIPWTEYVDGVFVGYLEYPALFARARALGAEVINVAHPLDDSGYFGYLGFDPPTDFPRLSELPPEKFSPAFDTIELLNGKRVDMMIAEVLPLWSNLNNQGLFRTASGTSDTHERTGEAGFGRTMVASSTDEPGEVDLAEIWANLREGHAVVGGGLLVTLDIGQATVGSLVSLTPPFEVHVRVEAADWVPAEQVALLANGESLTTLPLAAPGVVDPLHPAVRLDERIPVDPAVDTWYAALATGPAGQTMDPVFRGNQAVGLTNAIRVDVDGDGQFDPLLD